MDLKDIRINGDRLRNTLETMAKIGATPGGGVNRLALSDEDKAARDLFVRWLEELNLEIIIDEMGNIFGKRPGKYPEAAPVMSGSHIDSQPNGGRFDGILGVMGPLEVLRTLEENQIETQRSIIAVTWTNEEGSRFPPAMVSSGVWAGSLERDWAYSRTDVEGKTFVQELERIGYRGTTPAKSWPLHAYYEYHIEQGPILERQAKIIGIPKGIVCLHWYDVFVEGQADHAGTTPMPGRRDALCAAAEMIVKVKQQAQKSSDNLVATVGEIQNQPNSRNVVSEKTHFTIDIRSWDDELALRTWEAFKTDFVSIAAVNHCTVRIEETWRVSHSPFDDTLVQQAVMTAKELGFDPLPMVSGAGHDASCMNQLAPTAMIFVPSIGGRSHAEMEKTSWKDCASGCNVLLHCMLKSASQM